MKILQMGPYPPPHGGVQTNIVAIRRFLLERRIPCSVINLTRHRRADAEEVYYPKSALEVLRLLARLRYDIVHLHIGGDISLRLLALGFVCCLLPRRKTVLTFHSGGYPASEAGKTARPATLRGFIFRRFDRIIGVNRQLEELFQRFGVPSRRVRLIHPHALPSQPPETALPPLLEKFFESHDPVLTTVGLLEPEYDLPLQIEAIGQIREQHPNAGLLIVGSGSLEETLRETIESKPYGEHVMLCGDLEHSATLRAISESDLFLRTTLYDGDSISVREALHLGVTVIATDNGMRPDGVRLIPPSDLESLREAIERNLDRSEPPHKNGQADEKNLQEVLKLYRELIEEAGEQRSEGVREWGSGGERKVKSKKAKGKSEEVMRDSLADPRPPITGHRPPTPDPRPPITAPHRPPPADHRPPTTDHRSSRAFRLAVVASAVVLYLVLSVGRSLTDSPGCDEGWFASPAFNLVTKGHFATTVLEESNMVMTTGLHQYTYWVMPLNLLAQAAWYEAFGFSLISMRMISILWGLVALTALFYMLKTLSGDKKVALLAFALIAVDFAFIRSASSGRMDMMSVALNFSALAAYLLLRERNFTMALLAGQSIIVASGLTHPNGLLGFISLSFLILYFDRRNLKIRHLFIAATPYLIGGAAYGLYIINDSRLFLTQLSGNSAGRLWGLASPWGALKFEIAERYIGSGASGAHILKLSLLLAYITGIAGALFTREIRSHKGYRALLILAAIHFAYFTFFEGTKLHLYLVHVAPLYAALLVAWVRWIWANAKAIRWLTATAVCGLILIHLAGSAYVMRRDSYHKNYLPAVAFLNRNSTLNTTITGTAELSFGLASYDSLLDDKYIGYYSGRRPDMIVIDSRYEEEHEAVRVRQPEIYRHIQDLLAREYQKVYDQSPYRIYARR